MPTWAWFTVHHAVSVATFALTITLASNVLRSRRPASASTAWLLGIVLIPYLAIPLYFVLGDRKLRVASRKPAITFSHAPDPTPGSVEISWLDRPELAFARLLREIGDAKQSIHISTFILGDDDVGRQIVGALIARAREGIEVCVLLDGLFARRAPHGPLAELRAAGGRVAIFLPLLHLPWRGRTNVRNHRKLAIFDGACALMGGMNLADEYMGPTPRVGRWRDLSVVLTKGSVDALAEVFRADWSFAGGGPIQPIAARARALDVDVIPTGPDRTDDPWHDTLLQLVFDARHRIFIATPYFAPDESLLRALEIAARRGVEVVIVVPAHSNHWLADRVAAPMLRELVPAGVKVWCFGPAMLHAKCLLVDDAITAVGSANFNARSLFLDFEISVVIRGVEHNRWMAAWFAETLAASQAGPTITRGPMRAIESMARLLAPLA